MRHIISILLQNEAGALARVAGLFSSRGYNIESLHVAPTHDHSISRLTLVTMGSDQVIEQICNQMLKLVDVVNLFNMTEGEHIERELLLIKVRATPEGGKMVDELVRMSGARLLDDRPESLTLELTASGPSLDRFMEQVGRHGEIVTVVRSGTLAITRGAESLEQIDG